MKKNENSAIEESLQAPEILEEAKPQEETKELEDLPIDEEDFNEKLDELMQVDEGNHKKKKKKKEKKKIFTGWKKWSRKRKIITVVGTLAVVLLLFQSMGGQKTQAQKMVMTTPILQGDISENLTLSGPVSGTDSADVVSNLHAEVLEISVKEGDHVEKDQPLAVIDSTDIQKEAEMAQNAYDLAVTTYKEQQIAAENGYAKAVQDYQAAKADYDRTGVLFQAGSAAQLELETAKNKMDDAARQMKTFTIKDGKAVANESYALQIKNAEFDLEKKKKNLEDTQVKSPISGTVVRVNAKVGRFADKIEDDKPMFIIDNLEVLEMKIPVSEYSIGKIQVGQEASISADILNGETVKGSIVSISPTGEEKGGGSTERVIPTTIRIEEQNTKLIAGITAKAQIILSESKETTIVPISSLIEKEDGTYIALAENGKIKLVKVETGVESDIQVEILSTEGVALNPDTDQVVTNPTADMTDGMTVVIMPAA